MTDKPFALRDEPTRWDVLLLFVAPTALLLSVYFYPNSTQILEYKARNPTVLTILGSNLAHRGFLHIAGTIFGLWIIGGMGFILACANERKRLYYSSFIVYLVVLPFFADLFIRWMLADTPERLNELESVGFSQTVAAVTGFLALSICMFAQNHLDENIRSLPTSLGLWLSGFSFVLFNFGDDLLLLIAFAGSGLLAIAYIVWRVKNSTENSIFSTSGVLFTAGILMFCLALLRLFPANVGGGFYGHMAGYVWGYILPTMGIFAIWCSSRLSEEQEPGPSTLD